MDQKFHTRKIARGSLISYEAIQEGASYSIVLLHGYGANGQDLFPLHQEIKLDKPVCWHFLEAPFEGPAVGGKAWFPIDMQALEKAVAEGTHRDFREAKASELDPIKNTVLEAIASIDLPQEQILIGGFSQGAMLATEIFLSSEKNYRALSILSGNPMNLEQWENWAKKKPGLDFFQSHGNNDPLLSYEYAKELYRVLLRSGLNGTFCPFDGGHEIPPSILSAFGEFLNRVL